MLTFLTQSQTDFLLSLSESHFYHFTMNRHMKTPVFKRANWQDDSYVNKSRSACKQLVCPKIKQSQLFPHCGLDQTICS